MRPLTQARGAFYTEVSIENDIIARLNRLIDITRNYMSAMTYVHADIKKVEQLQNLERLVIKHVIAATMHELENLRRVEIREQGTGTYKKLSFITKVYEKLARFDVKKDTAKIYGILDNLIAELKKLKNLELIYH